MTYPFGMIDIDRFLHMLCIPSGFSSVDGDSDIGLLCTVHYRFELLMKIFIIEVGFTRGNVNTNNSARLEAGVLRSVTVFQGQVKRFFSPVRTMIDAAKNLFHEGPRILLQPLLQSSSNGLDNVFSAVFGVFFVDTFMRTVSGFGIFNVVLRLGGHKESGIFFYQIHVVPNDGKK